MALGGLPPWLSVSPKDFLLATQAGVQAGHAIANSAQLAFEKQQQLQMEQEKAKAQLAQQAIENAAQRLAAERLEQYRRNEVANQQQRLGIEQQGLGLRGTIASQEQEDRRARLGLEAQRLTALQSHQKALEEEQKRRNDAYALSVAGRLSGPPKLSDVDKGLMGADVTQLKALEKQIGGTEEHGFGLFHPLGGNKSQLADLRKQADVLRSKIRTQYGGKQRLVYNPDSGKIEPGQPLGNIPSTPTTNEDEED